MADYTLIERAARVEQTYSPAETAKLLGVSRATFYRSTRLGWLRSRAVQVSERRVGYLASDIVLYQAMQRGAA
jgi:predicted DNA-binding transcriptional regulator AlpA